MGQTLQSLAKNGAYRQIFWHALENVVYIFWDKTTIRLWATDFIRIVRLLEAGVVELNLTNISDGYYMLKQEKVGCFQLKVAETRLYLPLMDFLTLVTLSRTAARRLQVKPGNQQHRRCRRADSRTI